MFNVIHMFYRNIHKYRTEIFISCKYKHILKTLLTDADLTYEAYQKQYFNLK